MDWMIALKGSICMGGLVVWMGWSVATMVALFSGHIFLGVASFIAWCIYSGVLWAFMFGDTLESLPQPPKEK